MWTHAKHYESVSR